jgi:hypothetical protein
VQALQPFSVADVSFASRHVLRVPGVDHHHLEPALLQNFEDRDPVDPGGLHGDRFYSTTGEPVRQPMKVIGESLERPDRFRVAIRANGRDMHGGTDVDRGRGGMNRGQTRSRTGAFRLRHAFYPPA